MTYPVPILLIIWRRPDTTKVVINAIKNIKPSSIYIACDGPRLGLEEELEKVNSTKNLAIESIDWDCIKHVFPKLILDAETVYPLRYHGLSMLTRV